MNYLLIIGVIEKIFPIEKLINYKLNNYDVDEICELENITPEYFFKSNELL